MKQEYIDVPQNSDNNNIDFKKVKVVVITTVMLSFISYWRAAAVVVSDIGSSAFYALGIAEKAVGPSAPWFILFVMLFAYGIRAVYIESSSMFVRGGSYRVVRKTLGSKFAKIAVSALVFDYLITAPISAVSAGQYLGGLINSLLHSARPWLSASYKLDRCGCSSAHRNVFLEKQSRRDRGIQRKSSEDFSNLFDTRGHVVCVVHHYHSQPGCPPPFIYCSAFTGCFGVVEGGRLAEDHRRCWGGCRDGTFHTCGQR